MKKKSPVKKVAKKLTANERVDAALAEHAPVNTTEGIQRTLAAHDAALKALADHIDGKH